MNNVHDKFDESLRFIIFLKFLRFRKSCGGSVWELIEALIKKALISSLKELVQLV